MTEVTITPSDAPQTIEIVTDDSRKNTPSVLPTQTVEDPSARFRGGGTSFRAKLIGVDDVLESRGDKMCQDSILKLKAIVKASGQHKQKIVINITLEGIKLIDLMTAQVIHEHSVEKISFIARDQTDRRAFGYVLGLGDGKHQFFGIKTAKIAEHVVLSLRDLFQVVFDMKKKEIEEAKKNSEPSSAPAEPVYSVPNNKPLNTADQPQGGSILQLEEQLQNMQQMSDMEAFKSTWSDSMPTSPDTPGGDMNMFGTTDNASNAARDQAAYSDDLAGFDMEALEPAADGGAKLTKDQILAGFGPSYRYSSSNGAPASLIQYAGGMQQQQQASSFFGFQQQQQQFGAPQQAAPYGAPRQAAPFGAPQQSAPFGVPQASAPFAAPQQPGFGSGTAPFAAGQSVGMFSPGPRPVVPARTGAMRPPTATPAQSGAAQNPFGDAFGGSSSGSDSLLAPINSQPKLANGSSEQENSASDPFAALVPGLGVKSADKKDMFKNFQMAKPQPTTQKSENDDGGNVSANFDDYFRKSVGGVPLDINAAQQAPAPTPTPAPRSTGLDMFGLTSANPPAETQQSSDPFAAFGGSSLGAAAQQPANNTQSLFG